MHMGTKYIWIAFSTFQSNLTLGQKFALTVQDVLGAIVPLSGTTEKGSNTRHWNLVTSSLWNKKDYIQWIIKKLYL